MDAGLKRARMTSLTITLSLIGAMLISTVVFPSTPYLGRELSAGRPLKDEVSIQYTTFDGRPVQMIFDRESSRIWLRISSSTATDQKDLEYLKQEVRRLIDVKQSVVLGNTGYTFAWKSGYPIWGPTIAVGPGYQYRELLFGENAIIVDTRVNKEVRALGTKTILGFWPYK